MSVLQINKKRSDVLKSFALFELGFRPFFLGASLFSIASMVIWMLVYAFSQPIATTSVSITQWHAHEMIYGYTMAVVAGFLLTAIMNWTGVQTIHGSKLRSLFTLWVSARILMFFGTSYLELAAIFDTLFMTGLVLASAYPIILSKQWRQLGILTKLLLLFVGNLLFYLGAFGILDDGLTLGIYGGLYLIISLILTIGGRVLPMFIRNVVSTDYDIPNPKGLMVLTMVLFLAFFINQLFVSDRNVLVITSLGLAVVTIVRLYNWHVVGIWSHPLLWSLFLAFVSISLGFLLYALSALSNVSPLLAVHAFTYGGIGLATLGMMSRVALGHTGRNIRGVGKLTSVSLSLLVIGTFLRVILPIFNMSQYLNWIILSQLCWILAFSLFLISYAKILIRPRIDGQPG